MPFLVCMGAQLKCLVGTIPSSLVAIETVLLDGKPAATINDNIPLVNFKPFGKCGSPTNPANATGSAPCTPTIVAPWAPGSLKVAIHQTPALTQPSKLDCTLGGVISILDPGQLKVDAAG